MLDDIVKYTDEVKKRRGRVGVFSVGHSAYWPQFPNLKGKINRHFKFFVEKLRKEANAEIIDYDEISDNCSAAYKTGMFFSKERLDLIICFTATYSPAVNATGVIRKLNDVPSILVCLQPTTGMEYEKATIELQLENDNITSLPEITNTLNRMNRGPLDCVVGMLYDDERAWSRIKDWCEVSTVAHKLKHDHIGLLGHGFEGMLDMNSDPTMFDAHFGMHVEHIEMEDLDILIKKVTNKELNEKTREIESIFDFPDPGADPIATKVRHEDLEWPGKVACGMDKLICSFKLTGLAYYYRGLDNRFEQIHSGMIIGNSLLTSKGIAIAGEFDLKNCVAMLIMDRFGVGGSFTEFHPIDFREDFVLVGHDGPHHLTIADGKPVLRKLSLLHGKRGRGPSVEYKLKVGPITMLGLTQTFDGQFKMIVAEGESLPGKIPATGNTNTYGKFLPDVRTFLERWSIEGPTHHFALGIGHIAHRLEMLAKYLGFEMIRVTPENATE